MKKKLAILTVNYENYAVTDDFLESLSVQTDDAFKVFIADLSLKKNPIKSTVAHVVLPEVNKGYAYGINRALEKAIAQEYAYFVVVNNDTILRDDFVERAWDAVEAKHHNIIGGKIYYAPGFEYHKKKYSRSDRGKVLWYAGGTIDWKHVQTLHRGVDEVDLGQYDTPAKTDFVTGCMMLFDKSVVDTVGLFDEGYFLYYEDADFCVRAAKKGIALSYDPFLVLWHKNAQSTGGSGSSLHTQYQERNRVTFGLKYAPLRTKIHLLKNFLLSS